MIDRLESILYKQEASSCRILKFEGRQRQGEQKRDRLINQNHYMKLAVPCRTTVAETLSVKR